MVLIVAEGDTDASTSKRHLRKLEAGSGGSHLCSREVSRGPYHKDQKWRGTQRIVRCEASAILEGRGGTS